VIFGAISKWTGADDSPECTVAKSGNEILKEPKLTIGLDLGDRSSHYCILDEAGKVILEHDLPTTPKGVEQIDVLAGYANCEVPLNAISSCPTDPEKKLSDSSGEPRSVKQALGHRPFSVRNPVR
jgi:hypothetical protein